MNISLYSWLPSACLLYHMTVNVKSAALPFLHTCKIPCCGLGDKASLTANACCGGVCPPRGTVLYVNVLSEFEMNLYMQYCEWIPPCRPLCGDCTHPTLPVRTIVFCGKRKEPDMVFVPIYRVQVNADCTAGELCRATGSCPQVWLLWIEGSSHLRHFWINFWRKKSHNRFSSEILFPPHISW